MMCSLQTNLAATLLRQDDPACAILHAQAAEALAAPSSSVMYRCLVLHARALLALDRADDALELIKSVVDTADASGWPAWFRSEIKHVQSAAKAKAREASERFQKAYSRACEKAENESNTHVSHTGIGSESQELEGWAEQISRARAQAEQISQMENEYHIEAAKSTEQLWGEIWDENDFVD